jgi:hypothetical protein
MAWWRSPLGQISLFACALAILQPTYLIAEHMRGAAPLLLADFLFQYALPVVIVCWIEADAKERRRTPCFDFGFFLLILWPLSLFVYCISSRGWAGVGLSFALLMLAYVPAIVTLMVSVVWAMAASLMSN